MPIIGSWQNYQNNISYGCFPQTILQMNLTWFIYSLSKRIFRQAATLICFSIYISELLLGWYLHVQSQQLKRQISVWRLFKVNSKDIRTTSLTSFWCLHFLLWTNSKHVLVFPLLTLNKEMPSCYCSEP